MNESVAMTTFRSFLDENGWRYLTEEDGSVRGLVLGENGQCHWYAYVNGDNRFLVFKSFCPVNVSARRRPAAAEYLMRANWGLNFGNFEMDWSDGQVCFRTSVTTHELNPSSEALRHMMYGNHSTIDRYLAGLMAVACGSTAPSKAISEAEKDLQQQQATVEEKGAASRDNGEERRAGRKPRRFSPNDN
jgi:hypothetical protein